MNIFGNSHWSPEISQCIRSVILITYERCSHSPCAYKLSILINRSLNKKIVYWQNIASNILFIIFFIMEKRIFSFLTYLSFFISDHLIINFATCNIMMNINLTSKRPQSMKLWKGITFAEGLPLTYFQVPLMWWQTENVLSPLPEDQYNKHQTWHSSEQSRVAPNYLFTCPFDHVVTSYHVTKNRYISVSMRHSSIKHDTVVIQG